MAQKRKVLKEVLFDDVEEKIEYDFSMSVRGIEMWERYLQDPKGFKF